MQIRRTKPIENGQSEKAGFFACFKRANGYPEASSLHSNDFAVN
jgi:hypothetical protein